MAPPDPARLVVPSHAMAGRHRKPPAWRRVLTSMLRTRHRVRTAALRAEIVALRATVAALQAEISDLREAAAAAPVAATAVAAPVASAPASVTLDLPLVRLALDDVAVDRGPDVALTEIVLDVASVTSAQAAAAPVAAGPAAAVLPARDDRLAWSVLANLPERPLLDPRLDRPAEPVDPAAAAAATAATGSTPAPERRTA